MGIETGADEYTPRIHKRLEQSAREALARSGTRVGDPILQLPPCGEATEPWRNHPDLLAKAPEPEAILYGALDEADYVSYVRLTGEPPADVLAALDRWRPILATRAEIARNARRRWWETAWPRSDSDLRAPKVIGVHRTDRGRFALDEPGSWAVGKNACIVIARHADAPVAYLCGLLNSELLDLWYAVRGRTPWHVRRDYEPRPMSAIPYRPPDGDPRAEEVADLVRALAANRRALLPHRAAFPGLDAVVKNPWRTGPVEIDLRTILAGLAPAETVSLRLDRSLALDLTESAPARVARASRTVLELRRGKKVTGRIAGNAARLALLELVLGGKVDERVEDTLLPKDVAAFEQLVAERRRTFQALLDEGRELVERVERLVCMLYDVPDDLAERVVAHAVRRAS
jgi:hypothetical protein